MPAALLSVRGLAVRAGERLLIDDLDLDLAAGEIVAVSGPSGSGKTTLLRTLARLQEPAAGTFALGGESPEAIGWTTWRRRVGLMPQLPVMVTGTVAAELARPFGYKVSRHAASPTRGRELMDTLGLARIADQDDPARLSVGQQQRLALIRALLVGPDVLLLDEPTASLDIDAAESVREVLRGEVAARPAAVLMVTHDSGRAMRWCDRTIDLGDHGGSRA